MSDTKPDDRDHKPAPSAEREPKKRSQLLPKSTDVKSALSIGGVGVWVWTSSEDNGSASANPEQIHGLDSGTFDGTFSFSQNDIHPDDRAAVMAAMQRAMQEHGPFRVRYRLPLVGDEESRWIEARGGVVDRKGSAPVMLGICQDVSDRVKVEHELLARARQQELVSKLGSEALAEADLGNFLNKAAIRIAQELNVPFIEILELLPGDRELLMRAGTGWSSGQVGNLRMPADQQSEAGYTLMNGTPIIVDDLRLEKRFAGPAHLHDNGVVSGLSVIISGRDGRSFGVIGAHSQSHRRFSERDVAFLGAVANVIAGVVEQRLADQRQNLLIRELRHRSGNLFSQLLALFSQTARTATSIQDLATKFEARVMALANAHKLIAEGGWQATPLRQVLNVLLMPFGDRIKIEGPDLYLDPDPAFGLSAAVHELATNATKYGALSAADGQLELSWFVERTELGPTLKIQWREHGAPAPEETRVAGFGSRLIRAVIERQLSGRIEQNFTATGLHADIVIPLGHERWPQNRQPADGLSDPRLL